MRFLISALGSYGDVHPMVGLASALQARGHHATIITNPHFEAIVDGAGIGFVPLGTAEEYDALAYHPDLWHPARGPMLVLRSGMVEILRELYGIIDDHVVPGETVLVAHCLDLAGRIHQERHGTPLASVHFAPVGLRSFHLSPQMFGMLLQERVPRWLRRFQFWLADKVVDRIVCPELNSFRQQLGLLPVARVMHRWYFSPQQVLGLFPAWFAPPQPDWPPNTVLTGFPLWDQSTDGPLAPKLQEFLASGSAPIVFAPGSAMTDGAWFFTAAVEACRRLGRRGILLTKYIEQLPDSLPQDLMHCEFVPFSRLLPHAAALVHHGGIGTSSQGLAAGLPQVVMPMAYDQLDNATRLKRLGVAEILPRRAFTGARLEKVLDRILSTPCYSERGQQWAQKFDTTATMNASCEVLEQLRWERSGSTSGESLCRQFGVADAK